MSQIETTINNNEILVSSSQIHGFTIMNGNILIGKNVTDIQFTTPPQGGGGVNGSVNFTLYRNNIVIDTISSVVSTGFTRTHLFTGMEILITEGDEFIISTNLNVNLRGSSTPDVTYNFGNPSGGNLIYAEIAYNDPPLELDEVPCLTNTCNILTINGYKNVSQITINDIITTPDGRNVKINKIFKKKIKINSNNKPYKIPSHYYTQNKPIIDTFISKNHVFFDNKIWKKPYNDELTQEWSQDIITYYNFKLEDYHRDNIIVNGLIMESWDGVDTNEPRNYIWEKTKNGLVKKLKMSLT